MKKFLQMSFIILSGLFFFSCELTTLVTDIISKTTSTNEIKYSINYKNEEDDAVYQFKIEDIDTNYGQSIFFDFNNFHPAEGLYSSNGEVGVFLNLQVIEPENSEEPVLEQDLKCNFDLLTIVKFVDYASENNHTKYRVNIRHYKNINYYNLKNKNIIGDKNGYSIDSIYCNTECTYEDLINTTDILAGDFKKIAVNVGNKYISYHNGISNIYFFNNSESFQIKFVNSISGIYSKINPNKALDVNIRFKSVQ